MFFHNGTNYDFNLIINELAKEFKSELHCIPSNGEKFMSFSVPIREKVYAKSKNTKQKLLIYNSRFIDSARHMNESLSTLVDNLLGLNKCKREKRSFDNIKIRYGIIKNEDIVRTRCKKCLWRKDQKLSVLTTNFPNTFKLFCGNVSKFLLLLRKGVYPYEYMDSMSKFDEKKLPTIDNFYSRLNSSGISKEDYAHAKKLWEFFKRKDLGDYHDVYVQADVIQLSDVFVNFRSLCLKEYELDP